LKYIEVEKKYQLEDPNTLRAELEGLGAKPGSDMRQVDTYYNAPHRDFLAPLVVNEWLRVREEAEGFSINYKRWLPDDAEIKTHCNEFETVIEDAEAVRRMLRALDFSELVTVEKVREEWVVGEDFVVAFDTVTGLGDFVEIEFKGDAETAEQAIDRLDGFIATLGVAMGDQIHRGYPHILLGRDR